MLFLGLCLLLGLRLESAEVGMRFDETPPLLPGGLSEEAQPTLQAALDSWRQGESQRTIWQLQRWLEEGTGPWGRQRTAAQFLLGWLLLQEGSYNLASQSFTRVRLAGGPLESFARYYEALADHLRGRHQVAAGECERYRELEPEGRYYADCLLLEGEAWAQIGRLAASRAAYRSWREEVGDEEAAVMREQIQLAQALALLPWQLESSLQTLRQLAVAPSYCANGRRAREALELLESEGLAQPEPQGSTLEAVQQRALFLRDCGFTTQSWSLFEELRELHAEKGEVQAWVQQEEARFAWRTGRFERLAPLLKGAYHGEPGPDSAWDAFWVLWRAGSWQEASEFGQAAWDKYGESARWRKGRRRLAQALQLARRYTDARAHWDALAEGWEHREEARWFGAWCAERAGDLEQARSRWAAIQQGSGDDAVGARYFLARLEARAGRDEEAVQQWESLVEDYPHHWYGLLAAARLAEGSEPEGFAHRGSWPGQERLTPTAPAQPEVSAPVMAQPAPARTPSPGSPPAWSALRWEPREVQPLTPSDAPKRSSDRERMLELPPREDAWVQVRSARKAMAKLIDRHGERWVDLEAALDLASVGLFELAGPIVDEAHEGWKRRKLSTLTAQEWRQIFLYTGDFYHGVRSTVGPALRSEGEEGGEVLARHAWPIVMRGAVLEQAQRRDLDPMLMLALIRQESLFRFRAESPAGARGLMQIMPSTGSRIAYRMGDPGYSPASLYDARTSLRYGSWYLSKLMERFEGVWPLAVASYNTGPRNLSHFETSELGELELDDLVEQIPFRETRRYVQKVAQSYSRYVYLYGRDRPRLELPLRPKGDRREVVDF